jgi:hypothetical protein
MPIHLERDNILLGDALREVLDQAVAADVRDENPQSVEFGVHEGVIVVGDQSRAVGITRYYNVRDLVEERWPAVLSAPDHNERKSAAAGSGSLFPKRDAADGPTVDEILEELTIVFKETIDPENWRDNGGSIGSIHQFNGVLVVNTSWRNQRSIERMLSRLRETSRRPATRPTSFEDGALIYRYPPDASAQKPLELRVYDLKEFERHPLPAPQKDEIVWPWRDQLRGLVLDIDPDTWRENGGKATCLVFNDKLIVLQTAATQQCIAALLETLRAQPPTSRPAPPPVPPPAEEPPQPAPDSPSAAPHPTL